MGPKVSRTAQSEQDQMHSSVDCSDSIDKVAPIDTEVDMAKDSIIPHSEEVQLQSSGECSVSTENVAPMDTEAPVPPPPPILTTPAQVLSMPEGTLPSSLPPAHVQAPHGNMLANSLPSPPPAPMINNFAGAKLVFPNTMSAVEQKHRVETSPVPIYSVEFTSTFNSKVKFPFGIKKIKFGADYNKKTELPDSVEEVIFGYAFNQQNLRLPPHLRFIQFGYEYDQHVDLPASVIEVQFGNNFNWPISLPRGLKKVSFGSLFQQKLDTLPLGLEEIGFKRHFNYNIQLPHTIRVASFGKKFDKVVELGPNVERLQLGSIQPLPVPLPSSLKIIDVCKKRTVHVDVNTRMIDVDGRSTLLPDGCELVRR